MQEKAGSSTLWRVGAAEKYPEYAKRIDEVAGRIGSREAVLLEVEPVFGALILLLTKRFEILAQE